MAFSDQLRVGFIGAGWTDRVQIPVFTAAGLSPQAIASNSRENAARTAGRHGIPDVHTNWQELIANPDVDIVSVATPPSLHAEIAIAALKAGKHVISEKPTALDVRQAESMLAAAQAAPDRLAIIDHELRFHPQRRHLRQLIRDGFVGSVLHIHLDRLGSERLQANVPWNWSYDAAQGGGLLGSLGSHLLDLARWLIGRIEALTAQLQIGHLYRTDPTIGMDRQVTADDQAQLFLRFANGAQGTITASGITPGGHGMSILVVGTSGALKLDNQDQLWCKQGAAYPAADWEPVRLRQSGPPLPELPNNSPFTIGSFYLAQTLAMSLPMGEVILDDAASFYDGLVVQRALDAARRCHQNSAWERL